MAKLVLTTDCRALEMSTAGPRPEWIRVLLDWGGCMNDGWLESLMPD